MSGFTSLGKKTGGGGGGAAGTNANAIGPFGTSLVSNLTSTAQASFAYGTIPNSTQWVTSSNGTGAVVAVSEGIMSCSSGNSLSGSSVVQLARSIKYRPGQGVMGRMTAIFEPGHADTKQLAGLGNAESGYYFCRNGTNFGILHRESSKREIRSFSVNAQNAVTVVVTLGNHSKSFSISGGNNANQTSYLISQQDYSQVGSGWKAESIDGTVYFISDVPGPIGGTYGITVGGVSIVSATSQVQTGVLPTETFISQSSWNLDTMDGNGASRVNLDPSKGNIYGIGYQYLGFGDPVFSIENPESGLLTDVHRIQAANSKNTVVLRNPQTTARWEAVNSGSAASNVTVKGASAGIFNEGLVIRNIGTSFAAEVSKLSVSNTLTPLLSLRANRVYNNQSCYGEFEVFNISVGTDTGNASTGKILQVFVYKNATLAGPVNFQHNDSTRSLVAIDTAATSLSTNSKTQLLKAFIVAANNSITLKLNEENFFGTSGDIITIAAKSGTAQAIDTVLASVSWFEDQ
jgi:hypothetical protein